jgi:hypothetical protein
LRNTNIQNIPKELICLETLLFSSYQWE